MRCCFRARNAEGWTSLLLHPCFQAWSHSFQSRSVGLSCFAYFFLSQLPSRHCHLYFRSCAAAARGSPIRVTPCVYCDDISNFFSTTPSFLPHEVPSALYRSNCYLFPAQTDLSRRIAGPRDPTRCLPLLRPSSTSLLGAGIFTGDNNPSQQNGFTRLFRRCGAAQSPADAV